MKKILITLITLALVFIQPPVNADEIDTLIQERAIEKASRSASRIPAATVAVSDASKFIGTRYCRGGASPRCFDCSGFTQYIYAQQGISLPRGTHSQYLKLAKISKSQAKPGDLVFFLSKGGYAYHVGIYMGENKILHAPKPGRKVKIESIWSSRVKFATI